MTRKIILLLFLVNVACYGFCTIFEMFENKLKTDLSYQQLGVKKIAAEKTLYAYDGFYVPYLSIGTGSTGFVFDESGFKNGSVAINADFLHLWGVKVGVSLPYSFTRNEEGKGWAFDSLSLTLNRKLIAEDEADRLAKRADLIQATFVLEQRAWEVFTELIQQIFDYRYYRQLYTHYQEKATLYRQFWAEEPERVQKESYLKQALTFEKMITETKSLLIDYKVWDSYGENEIEALYNEIFPTLAVMMGESDSQSYPTRSDLLALQLQMQSAERKGAIWFLPYIPNPEFTLSAAFDVNTPSISFIQRISWTFSMKITLPILDRGERELEALNRQKNKELKTLELSQKRETLKNKIDKLLIKQNTVLLEEELKILEVEASREALLRNERLAKAAYITQKDLRILQIDQKEKEMELERAQQKKALAQIELMKELNTVIGGM